MLFDRTVKKIFEFSDSDASIENQEVLVKVGR